MSEFLDLDNIKWDNEDIKRITKSLKGIGISLYDGNNELRNKNEVFKEIADKFKSMKNTQDNYLLKKYICQCIAGIRHGFKFELYLRNL